MYYTSVNIEIEKTYMYEAPIGRLEKLYTHIFLSNKRHGRQVAAVDVCKIFAQTSTYPTYSSSSMSESSDASSRSRRASRASKPHLVLAPLNSLRHHIEYVHIYIYMDLCVKVCLRHKYKGLGEVKHLPYAKTHTHRLAFRTRVND